MDEWGLSPGVERITYAWWGRLFTDEGIDELCRIASGVEEIKGRIGGDKRSELRETVRKSRIRWLAPDLKGMEPPYKAITDMINEVNDDYFHFDLTHLLSFQFAEYHAKEKGHYDFHIDGGLFSWLGERKLSMSMLLNDPSEYEGGKFQFRLGTKVITPSEIAVKGQSIIFPSFISHRVTEVTKGVRKSLVVWACGPNFK